MWPKNIQLFAISESGYTQNLNARLISDELKKHEFSHCEPTQEVSFGWIIPVDNESNSFALPVKNNILIKARIETREISSKGLNDAVSKKVDQFEREKGYRPGKKERLIIKDELMIELLPKALTSSKYITAWFDTKRGWLMVDCGAESAADDFTAHLREALGELPVIPAIRANNCRPEHEYTHWFKNPDEMLQKGLFLGNSMTLALPTDKAIKSTHQNFESDDAAIHTEMNEGKEITKIGFRFNEQINGVIDQKLALKRLTYSDQLTESSAQSIDLMADWLIAMNIITEFYEMIFESMALVEIE